MDSSVWIYRCKFSMLNSNWMRKLNPLLHDNFDSQVALTSIHNFNWPLYLLKLTCELFHSRSSSHCATSCQMSLFYILLNAWEFECELQIELSWFIYVYVDCILYLCNRWHPFAVKCIVLRTLCFTVKLAVKFVSWRGRLLIKLINC